MVSIPCHAFPPVELESSIALVSGIGKITICVTGALMSAMINVSNHSLGHTKNIYMNLQFLPDSHVSF
jgi:hypothetical protein